MKNGRNRTMSICLSDIPKERILKHANGKLYLPVATFDYDQPDKYDNDFSVSMPLNKEELERKKNGEKVDRVFLGNGKIWEQTANITAASEEEVKDLPF